MPRSEMHRLKHPSDVLSQEDVIRIRDFVQKYSSEALQQIEQTRNKQQSNDVVQSFIHRLLDFILQHLPPNQSTAKFLNEWTTPFLKEFKQSEFESHKTPKLIRNQEEQHLANGNDYLNKSFDQREFELFNCDVPTSNNLLRSKKLIQADESEFEALFSN